MLHHVLLICIRKAGVKKLSIFESVNAMKGLILLWQTMTRRTFQDMSEC